MKLLGNKLVLVALVALKLFVLVLQPHFAFFPFRGETVTPADVQRVARQYLHGRNRIVISEFEFPTVGQIAHAQELRGAEVVHVRPDPDGSIATERFAEAIDERTALVCCTTVSYRTGHRHDVAEIARLAHEAGALCLADSYQAIGAIDFDAHGKPYLREGVADPYAPATSRPPGLSSRSWFSTSSPLAPSAISTGSPECGSTSSTWITPSPEKCIPACSLHSPNRDAAMSPIPITSYTLAP